MSNRILYIIIAVAVAAGVISALANYFVQVAEAPAGLQPTATTTDSISCTDDAIQCPDGLFIGRSGANCEFVCPTPTVPADVQEHIDAKANIIKVSSPAGMSLVTSPLKLAGEARGGWFFEAVAPVAVVNWDGLIIAEGYVTATGEWMTPEFVPFIGELTFVSPYKDGDPDFMKRGTIIFQKDNPSGLPENDDAVEIPILFTN